MNILIITICTVSCYLIGSIPPALIIGQLFFKTDIRQHGSHNLGGTNAARVLGKKAGIIVMLLDIIKSFVPIFILPFILDNYQFNQFLLSISLFCCGCGVAIGHCYPLFAKFKGGKTVSVMFGIILATNWVLAIFGLFISYLLLKSFKYVSLMSIVGSIIVSTVSIAPAVGFFMHRYPHNNWYTLTLVVITLLLIYRHNENIKRLIRGEEKKVSWI